MNASPSRYDLLYNPRYSVTDFPLIGARWSESSIRSRLRNDCYLDVPYGHGASEKMDIFLAKGPSKGLLVFIHGGYWRAQDKSGYSFLADAITAAGITLAIPNYALCPTVEVRNIVMQMVQCLAWLYRNGGNFGAPADKLFACGHSAGGHLAAMMLACLWPDFAPDLPDDLVKSGFAISGLYDLREIVKVPSINADVGLTRSSAATVSPALLRPPGIARLYMAVGEKETGGFHEQQRIMARRWEAAIASNLYCPDDNHFTVLDNLQCPQSTLFALLMQMMEISRT